MSGSPRRRISSGRVITQLFARGRKGDVMEKILPLIEELTTSRAMVPSDLTQDYASVAFPNPLSVTEVRV